MEQSSFKDRFSLGFLTSAAPQPVAPPPAPAAPEAPNPNGNRGASLTGSSLPFGIEAVLSSIGNQVLLKMKDMPNQSGNLLSVASISNMRFEAILPIVQFLASKGLVERTYIDPSGNDIYTVTPSGLDPNALGL